MAAKKSSAKKTVTVRQTRGYNRRPAIQETHLRSLGLGKIGRVRTLEDTPAIRGLIAKVAHLVEVVEE